MPLWPGHALVAILLRFTRTLVAPSVPPMPHHSDKPLVIVTGSSGLLGSAVLDDLRHEYQIVGFDRDGQPQPPREVECVCVDLTDDTSVGLGLDRVAYAYGNQLAAVVHLAAYYDFSGEPSPLYQEVTVKGTRRLLDGLNDRDFRCERFIFSSTMLIHAPTTPGKPITEDSPITRSWLYPDSKIDTERTIHEHRDGIPAVNLRIAGVYTDWGKAPTIVQQIKRIYERQLESHFFPGDMSHGQAFVSLNDTVRALRAAVEHRGDLPEETAILIGEPETSSFGRMQDRLGELIHGKDWSTLRVPEVVAKAGAWVQEQAGALPGVDEPFIKPWMVPHADDHYELDIGKARQMLGWEPEDRLIDALPTMVRRLESDPAEWYERNELGEPPE